MGVLVLLRERMSTRSHGSGDVDVELLVVGAQKILRSCCTRKIAWDVTFGPKNALPLSLHASFFFRQFLYFSRPTIMGNIFSDYFSL